MTWTPDSISQGKIPEQLRSGDFRFILIARAKKEPIEKDWNRSTFYSFFSHALRKHLIAGGNYGILCGPGNLIVIDADKPKFIEIIKEKLPPTFTVRTGSGQGLHFYYICPGASFNNFGIDSEHVGELRAPKIGEENVYYQCVAPGSVHPSGGIYEIETDIPIAHIELKVLWGIIGQYVTTKEEKRRAKRKEKQKGAKPEAGPKFSISDIPGFPWKLEKNAPDEWQGPHPVHGSDTGENLHVTGDLWYCHRCKCGGGPLSLLAIIEGIIKCEDHQNEDTIEMSGDEIDKTVGHAKKLGLIQEDQRASPFHLTDLGNAHRFVQRFGEDIRYCHDWGQWFEWDGIRWNRDNTGAIVRKAKVVALSIYAEASNAEEQERRRALASHAVKTESESRLNAMVNLTKSELGIPAVPEDFDKDHWLLNCKNGTVDLRTGELHPHSRDDLITKSVSVAYDTNAKCPRWNRFLLEITDKNENLVRFIKRAIGYSLTGSTQEQMFFLLYGTGANGKTTLVETLEALFDDYGATTNTDVFMQQKRGVPNDIARLRGARFVSAVEMEADRYLAESLIKLVTGGDTIAARFLFHEFFEFVPSFKLWLATNHKPMIRGTDHAMWRRIKLVPFYMKFDPQTEPTLKDTLLSELPGILAESVMESKKWIEDGLPSPNEVLDATKEYHDEMDILGDFINIMCDVGDDEFDRAGLLYMAYEEWCECEHEKPVSKRAFGNMLKDRGFRTERTKKYRYWRGLRLKGTPKQDKLIDSADSSTESGISGASLAGNHDRKLDTFQGENVVGNGNAGIVGNDAGHGTDINGANAHEGHLHAGNASPASLRHQSANGNDHDNKDLGTYARNGVLRHHENFQNEKPVPNAAVPEVTHLDDTTPKGDIDDICPGYSYNYLLSSHEEIMPKTGTYDAASPEGMSPASVTPEKTSQKPLRKSSYAIQNISINQQQLLKVINGKNGEAIEEDIVKSLGKHPQYVKDMIDCLEKMGYLQRDKQDPTLIHSIKAGQGAEPGED